MKKLFIVALVAIFSMSAASAYAQKMGRINMQELIVAMPEYTQMQTDLQAFEKELSGALETIQVEINNKFAEFQKAESSATPMTDSVRQLKEAELQQLSQRRDQFSQSAQQDYQKKYAELLDPIIKKAQEAVKKVATAGSYVVIYDISNPSLAYYDEAQVADVMGAVKTSLGI